MEIINVYMQVFKTSSLVCLRKLKHGLFENLNTCFMVLSADILKQYCDQHSIKEFLIPDMMTYDHPHQRRSRQVVL